MLLKLNICIEISKALKIIGIFIIILKVLVPIILIIRGTIDVFNVLIKADSKSAKESALKLFKNLIAGIIVFLVPSFIYGMVDILVDKYKTINECNECLFNPTAERCNHLIELAEAEEENPLDEDYFIYGSALTADLSDVPSDIRDKNYTKEDNNNVQTSNRSSSIGNSEVFLNEMDKISKKIETDVKSGKKWYYFNSGCKSTFTSAEESNTYKTNCALGIVWGLKSAGILDNNMSLWKKYENGINSYGGNMSEEEINKRFIVIEGNGQKAKDLIKDGTIQAGDVIMWYNDGHTNAYAGNNSWYDAGRNFTGGYGSMEEYYFKTLGPLKISYYEENQVWRILRIR